MYQLLLYRNEYSLAHCSALFPTFLKKKIYLFSGMLLIYVIIFQQNSWIIWKFGCHIVWESSYGLLYLWLLTLKKKKGNRELWKLRWHVLDMGMTCFFLTMPICLHKMLDHYACLLSCCLFGFYKNMEALHFFTGWHEWSSNLGYWDPFMDYRSCAYLFLSLWI